MWKALCFYTQGRIGAGEGEIESKEKTVLLPAFHLEQGASVFPYN